MMIHSEDKISRTLFTNGEEYLFFSGTSYLGLSSNPEFHEILIEGIRKYGSNHPMSRISNVRFDLYHQFEQQVAIDFCAEDCLSLSSGFLAGRLLIEYFKSLSCNIYISPEAHPALWLNLSVNDTKITHTNWITSAVDEINKFNLKNVVIFCNSLNSLSGEVYNFDWLNEIDKNLTLYLIVDDSHGIGILGENNKGVGNNLLKYGNNIKVLVTASLGKALGITGGAILGEKSLINILRKSTFYTSSSPIIPAYIYSYLQAKKLRDDLTRKLSNNIKHFKKNSPSHIDFNEHNFPVYKIEDNTISNLAYHNHIVLSSFPYPFQDSPLITRIVINAAHEIEDIEKLCTFLKNCMSKGDVTL